MSRYPPQGYYPPPLPPQQYYSNPDHPIPYRGLSQGARSPTSTFSQANSEQQKEDDKNAEDGGWGREGPLLEHRNAMAKRGKQKGVDSYDKTAVWLKTSQSGPSKTPEQVCPIYFLNLILADIVSHRLLLLPNRPRLPRLNPSQNPSRRVQYLLL